MNGAKYAVIFTSQRTGGDGPAYERAAKRMVELAAQQPGFVHVDSVRGEDGLGITVSYWASREAIAAWKDQAEHLAVQKAGKQNWYQSFNIKVCRLEAKDSE
jgi:heme-degrading monooxygenase HmoA